MAYDNSNSGVLFKNDDKRPDKRDPDYRGQAEVNNVLYWLDAWINESKKDGRRFLSIKFKEKETGRAQPNKSAPKSRLTEADVTDSEIPF